MSWAMRDAKEAQRLRKVIARLARLPAGERGPLVRALPESVARTLHDCWPLWAHPGQLPGRADWDLWLIRARRGFGKTRAGAEWVQAYARANVTARIALVGATADDVRQVMIEGPSGLLATAWHGEPGRWIAAIDARLVRVAAWRAAELLLMRSGPGQLHLGIWTGDALVHADAGIGRVVARPGVPPWPVLAAWRRRQ